MAERHRENSVKEKIPVTDNKVEYNFYFIEKYEKQSDQRLINVKGNLKRKKKQNHYFGKIFF